MQDFFTPPPNGAEEDPSLPRGSLVVTIRDAQDRPIPGAPIRLDILHSSVARGDSRERKNAVGDDTGSARFDGLGAGSAITYRVSTTRGPATFSAPPFPLGDQAGKRAVVHAYDATENLDQVFVLSQGSVFLALRDDAIVVEQSVTLGNLDATAWMADFTIKLPEGFKALNREDPTTDVRLDEVHQVGVALRGTVAPGRHDLRFRYNVPLERSARQTIRIEPSPRLAQTQVIAEAAKNMGLEVIGFPDAQRTELRNGMKVLFSEQRAQRQSGGLKTLVITLSGLPTPPPGRWVAIGLAAIAVLGSLAFVVQKKEGSDTPDDNAQRDLLEAHDALLNEFVELERARKREDIGPRTYARVREALLDALARIVTRLEETAKIPESPEPQAALSPEPAPRARRPRRDDKGSTRPRSGRDPESSP
ncbi:Hypothetical protein CAP_5371 [Chondromyces apiculatus DSM 436]|uniref:Uncharacterized protein n=2 Tax=Chondromyces apiculatus TaxID=51 RepID=A0A017T462_9BACT|nr:Hypothetical protein CAP_5371 [Chondromyces apiculatus DSM 436]